MKKKFELMQSTADFSVYKSKDVGVILKNKGEGKVNYLTKYFKKGFALAGELSIQELQKAGLDTTLERLEKEIKEYKNGIKNGKGIQSTRPV